MFAFKQDQCLIIDTDVLSTSPWYCGGQIVSLLNGGSGRFSAGFDLSLFGGADLERLRSVNRVLHVNVSST